MALKRWDGTQFVDAIPTYWNGSQFVEASSAHIWDGTQFVEVWSAMGLVSSGISLTGLSSEPTTHNAWGDVTGGTTPWQITAGFSPDTAIVDGYKIAVGGAGNVSIYGQVTWTGSGLHTRGARVVRTRAGVDTVVTTGATDSSTNLTRTASGSDACQAGDVYRLQGYTGDTHVNDRRPSVGTRFSLTVA